MTTEEAIERIADLSDRADNYAHAANLPIEPELHVRKLKEGMERLRDDLRHAYIETTGNNPWV